MASPVRKRATYEDLLGVPDDRIAEIVDGDLHASPRPASPHAGCAFALSTELPRVPPDVAVEAAPDWACEILSPSTERLDRARKLPAYARHGVSHAWLVNPAARTLEVMRRDGERFEAMELDLLLLWDEQRA